MKLLLAGVRKWRNPSRVLLDWQEKVKAVAYATALTQSFHA